MAHTVTAVPVEKLRDGIIGYRFECSCGRVGVGRHARPGHAVEVGLVHTNPNPQHLTGAEVRRLTTFDGAVLDTLLSATVEIEVDLE